MDVLDRLKAVISTALKTAVDEIEDTDSFRQDLGADSLDMVRILDSLEKEFAIEIPEDDEDHFETVGSCAAYLKQKTEPGN